MNRKFQSTEAALAQLCRDAEHWSDQDKHDAAQTLRDHVAKVDMKQNEASPILIFTEFWQRPRKEEFG